MHANAVAAALGALSLGPDITFENLTMIPLLRNLERNRENQEPENPGTCGTLSYRVLDEALASGLAEITEVSAHGSVPELKFVNRGPDPVLIVDGEELVGAKQNRVVNLTILAASQCEMEIPVSCVEAGRWRARSHAFASAPRTQFATGRAKRVAQVTASLCDRGDRMSDQAEVWADIAEKSSRMKASSPTSAMEAIFAGHSASIDRYVDACKPVDGQVGALFAVNGAIVGFDVFDRESTLRRLLPKLVRSVAVDAIDAGDHVGQHSSAGDPPSPLARALAAQFLAVVSAAPQHAASAVGLGDDVRLTAPQVAGAALVVDQHVVHLAAFAL